MLNRFVKIFIITNQKQPHINQSINKGGSFMKKLRSLLVVTTLLMVLGFALPVGQAGANLDEGITVCCDGPSVDTFGLY